MSACNTFTEHVWKPGECKNCFKPKSLHRLAEAGLKNRPQERPVQLQSHTPAAGRPNANVASPYVRSGGSGHPGHFRPPVAKKPTIAVKPTMMLSCSSAGLDSEGNRVTPDAVEAGKIPDFAAWNRNGTNWKRPSGVNNNEGEDGGEEFEGYGPRSCRVPASGNNNGLTEVLKEIAGLGTDLDSSSGSSSRDLFLGRISTSYKRSLERGLPASSCLAMGSSRGGASHKHVSLSDSTEVISTEGGRFCYPEFSSEGEEEEEESEGDDGGEHESWDESDEELLAMEIRMRGQPRFANFRAATLSPVPFAAGKKWNTVPLRNRSLQRICAVDYDDSYDEILNGYPSVDSNGGFVPFGQHDLQGSSFFSNSESTTSPESSSSAPEDSRTTTSSSTSSAPSHLPNGLHSPIESRNPVPDSAAEKESAQQGLRSPKVSETHKAVLAIRLEEQDGNQKEGGPLPQALPGQPVTISFSPTDEQAKPYRVVSLEKAPICKPYTVVDVSASMGHTEKHPTDNTSKPKGSSISSTSSPSSPLGMPLSPTSPVSPTSLTPSALLNVSRKKPGNIRYQEVWTSSTSPRQKVPKVELVGGATSGPVVPPRHCSHKSAPTSPTAGLSSSSRTVPVKSPNLSEIKFNSYNNAGMPPFPIIIRDEPTYARGSKNAVKVPIVINPSAYDNLAVYKSFLGVSGEIPPTKTAGSGRVTSHTYEEIGSAESTPSSPIETCANGNLISEKVTADEKKVGSVAQKIQELNSGSITVSSMTPSSAAMNSLLLTSPQMGSLAKGTSSAVSQGCFGKVSRETTPDKGGTSEYQPSTGTGSSHREKASTVLSQIVASIQPPQSPPESPMAQSKTCSVEELYAVPPDATKDTLSRPKSLFSTTDGCLSKPRKDGTSKQLPKSQSSSAAIPPTSPRSEPNAPFPPPRSTSSPYHAANLLQRHFGNWSKPAAGTSRPSEGETSPGGGEGKRAGAESTKPKRWISFKSFFRRRKDEDEQRERSEREKEKGKLLGLDGTVIHMLPPPPIQRHHWFTEAKADDPSQKPTIIFTYKPEVEASVDGEEGQQLHAEEPRETLQPTYEQTGKQQKSGTSSATRNVSTATAQGTEGHAPTSLSAMLEMSCHTEPSGAAVMQLLGEGAAGPGEPDDNNVHFPSRSHSPASSTCSATYSNLGQSRANMIPLKQPRNPKASDDTLPTGDPEGSDGGPKATPPPLPKKNIARANTEPSALGRELLAPRPKGEAKPGGSNLSVANPLYDLDSTWETASQGSSMGSEARPPDQESGDSLERPAAGKGRPATSLSCMTSPATVSAGRQPKRGCRSVESLSGRGRGGTRSQRAGLYKGMDNWEEVLGRIRGLHTDTLRKLACRCEDRFMAGQKDPLRFGTDSWSDFRLTTGRPCCEAGDAVYYTASYAKDPLVNYAVKICRSQVKETQQQLFHSLAVRQSLAPHFNIQQDCGHFLADVPLRLLPWEEDDQEEEEEEEEERKACESNERAAKRRDAAHGASSPGQPKHSVSAGRLRSRVVVITREVPFQTVADFVQQGAERHTHSPDLYERQVCLLLLQLCQGLEHMKPYHVTHCDLRLENLLLIHCQPGNPWNLDVPEPNNNNDGSGSSSGCPARLIISNFSQAKQKSPLAEPGTLREQARLAPEIVTATQYRKCDEFQTGILIYEMLHRPNPFEETPELKETEYTCADLPALPVRSLYSRGLQRLASLLLDANPSERIQISDARACLQCLLWGPREDLFQALAACPGPVHRDAALQNWLDLKRTLMMIKFAERSLDSACGVSLEDWLCCQYLSSANTDSLARVVRILQPMQPQPQQL
ncbi:inactive tyrosine-protein kinase PEAK1 [Brienomyrus brachyistius]|uniref:inactive tyrosine-protein kinase PEAK1 n=1 Tax=Brienomyrus brachyistius TaxID=42636 RepID=UPI0020B2943F|nr:inactive tyrosine-protein kinase PEAK1 [Brienomyrus brachyistius]XP_048828384.1 inactive tyrosine-protein kinase PEAK1 [Brienomyrus brachyistius]XP_048828385.1 inactive tyrosine-protein kinase PEAK1 [Brienomyrus brachyistius]XP_048828386.1 inactive tyrosine-protein kinase PEAK1 [Brienomyrus brachyistius]XP_048828387.1 inactive tyrosine-protein kinase PEAK1 [Brienomyrus brachyistius]XP_048828388.1 inactive tyrosine-protein kinase PEAK1 [Brienomyrus brachyistius]XP_048828389.1 inactive tyros